MKLQSAARSSLWSAVTNQVACRITADFPRPYFVEGSANPHCISYFIPITKHKTMIMRQIGVLLFSGPYCLYINLFPFHFKMEFAHSSRQTKIVILCCCPPRESYFQMNNINLTMFVQHRYKSLLNILHRFLINRTAWICID